MLSANPSPAVNDGHQSSSDMDAGYQHGGYKQQNKFGSSKRVRQQTREKNNRDQRGSQKDQEKGTPLHFDNDIVIRHQ
jgi:hypothetical protein